MGYKNKKWINSTIAFILVFYESTFTLMDTRATLNFFVTSTLHQKPFAILLIQKAWGNRGAPARNMPPLRTRAIPGSTPGATTTGDAVIIPLRPGGGTYGPGYGPASPPPGARPGSAPRPAQGGPYDREVEYCNNGHMDACPVGTEVSNQDRRPIPQPGAFWRCWGVPTNCSKWIKVSTLDQATPYPRDAGPQWCPPGGCQGTPPPGSRYSSPAPGQPDELGPSRRGPQYQPSPLPWEQDAVPPNPTETQANGGFTKQQVDAAKIQLRGIQKEIQGAIERDPLPNEQVCRDQFRAQKQEVLKRKETDPKGAINGNRSQLAQACELLRKCLKEKMHNQERTGLCNQLCSKLGSYQNAIDGNDKFFSDGKFFGQFCKDWCAVKARGKAEEKMKSILSLINDCR
jgi:hypothetical protein